ncbi:MAG: Thermonuclease [Nitrospira sp.]|nr:Thermonuclease [Nitrospira sp.]
MCNMNSTLRGIHISGRQTVLRTILTVLLALGATGALAQGIVGVASVIDGDTIELHGTRIRLAGIDAPESRQECQRPDGTVWRCGQKAALALSDHLGGSVLKCVPSTKDRYGRTVATCFLGSEDINRWMVMQGWAVAYRQYSRAYVQDEDHAHAAQAGIWSGRFTMPSEWRAGHR